MNKEQITTGQNLLFSIERAEKDIKAWENSRDIGNISGINAGGYPEELRIDPSMFSSIKNTMISFLKAKISTLEQQIEKL